MSHTGMRVCHVRSVVQHTAPGIVTANAHICIYNSVTSPLPAAETDLLQLISTNY